MNTKLEFILATLICGGMILFIMSIPVHAYTTGTSLVLDYNIASPITLVDGRLIQYTPNCLIDCWLPIEVTYSGALSPASKSVQLKDLTSSKSKVIGLDNLENISYWYVANNTYLNPVWIPNVKCVNVTKNATQVEECTDTGSLKDVEMWGYFLEPISSMTVEKAKPFILVVKGNRRAKLTSNSIDLIPSIYSLSMDKLAWFNTSWSRKQAINVSVPSGTTPKLYTIVINVSYDTDMNSDFSDLRFTNASENTELDYWIESKVTSSWAYVWVELAENITTTNQTLAYIYYGNPSATTTSNFLTPFMFSDDFNRADSATVNNGWVELDGGAGSIETNRLKISAGGSWGRIYHTVENQTAGIAQGFLYNETVSTGNGMRWDLSAKNMYYGGEKSFTIAEGNAGYFGSTPLWANIVAMTIKTMYRVEARMNQTKVNFTINGTEYPNYAITAAGNCNIMDNISFGEYSGTGYIDNAYVRKFQTPEPTFNIGTEETSGGGGATSPQYSNIWNNSATIYSPTQTSYFNITWTNGTSTSVVNISAVNFTSNYSGTTTNYNMTFLNGNTNSANFTYSKILPAGVFTWNSSAKSNDTTPALNTSNIITFTVVQATPTCTLSLSPTTPISYETNTTAVCSCNSTDTGVSVKLYRNTSDVTTQNNTLISLAANTYNYVCNSTSTANFTVGTTNSNYIVSAKNAIVQVNPTTQSVPYRTSVNQYCLDSSSFYTCQFWRNNSLMSNNSNILLGVGAYIYVANITDTSNYTNYQATSTLTIAAANPPINITFNTSDTVTQGTPVMVTCNYSLEVSPTLYNDTSSIANNFNVTTSSLSGTYNYTCNSTATANYTAGTASKTLTIGVAGALIVSAVYDEKTLSPLTFNITVYNDTFSTSQNNIASYNNDTVRGNLTLAISSVGYIPRNYYVNILPSETVTITGYLLSNIDGVYITYWAYSTSYPTGESGTLVNISRFIGSNYTLVSQSLSDYEGKGTLWLDPYISYRIIAEKGALNYSIDSYSPNPSILLRLNLGSGEGISTSNYTWLFTDLAYSLTPTDIYIRNDTDNLTLINYTLYDLDSLIVWQAFKITNQSGTVIYSSNSSTPSGTSLTANYNMTGREGQTFIVQTSFKRTGYDPWFFNRTYIVYQRSSTLLESLEGIKGASGLGLSSLAGSLIGLFAAFTVAAGWKRGTGQGASIPFLLVLLLFVFVGIFDYLIFILLGIVGLIFMSGGRYW